MNKQEVQKHEYSSTTLLSFVLSFAASKFASRERHLRWSLIVRYTSLEMWTYITWNSLSLNYFYSYQGAREMDIEYIPLALFFSRTAVQSRFQWLRGLRHESAAALLLGLWVRIPSGAWRMSVSCQCSELSGRCLCDEPITRPEESYRLCRVNVCDLETSSMKRPWPALGRSAITKEQLFEYFMTYLIFTAKACKSSYIV